eukprot:365375-Chlamydomonas_euryale.AAC.6
MMSVMEASARTYTCAARERCRVALQLKLHMCARSRFTLIDRGPFLPSMRCNCQIPWGRQVPRRFAMYSSREFQSESYREGTREGYACVERAQTCATRGGKKHGTD